jgi:RimJ/RimL family protein N-acetyltransferase
MHPLVRTERLDLEALSLEDAHALLNGEAQPDRSWVEGYPSEGTLVGASFVVTADRERRHLGPFRAYQIVRRADRAVIGDCGFLGAPDRSGAVHVAFGIAESARNEGYGTEALEGLIGYAFTHDRVSCVRAETARDNVPAQRVMEKAGMAPVEERDDTLVYEA